MAHADKSDNLSDVDQTGDATVENNSGIEDQNPVEHPDVQENEDRDAADKEEADQDALSDDEIDMDGQAEVSVEELLTQLEAAREEVGSYKDMALRAEAEVHNIRRRAQQDVEKAHRFGLERFLTNLLPVIDSLEKAIESANQTEEKNEAIIEGVELCLKMLLELLQKENIQQIDPEGEPFDPQYHEAMSVMENPDVEPNTVVNVFQKGYTLNDRLVRAAMVIVSKAP